MSLLYAAGLSLSSSSDNFAVGVSLGLSELSLPVRLNAIVAVANAAGALVATHGGQAIGSAVPTLAPALASLVFGYLAWDELGSWTRGESASPLAKLAAEGVAVRLAVPMTLNNLAVYHRRRGQGRSAYRHLQRAEVTTPQPPINHGR